MTEKRKHLNPMRIMPAVCLLLIFLVLFSVPAAVGAAEKDKKTVRVGWHEVPYFITDADGRRSGYSYEYQCKLAAYTGWNYEYVEGSWSELLQMLMDGEIDLLSDVSYLEERAENILYSSIPMGTEAYYVYVSPDNTEITAEDYTALNGKTVGVARDSFQKEEFLTWADSHGIQVDLREMTCPEEESLSLLGKELDAFVTMDVYGDPDVAVPISKVGSSDFYFALSKDRQDLLPELDAAMNRIQDEDKFFNQELHEKYLRNEHTDRYLSDSEKDWLAQHGPIRVGYQDNYLAFCAKDPATGELTGALKDYLDYASTALENGRLDFTSVAFATPQDAMDAMERGEVDCVFPANLTDYDSERLGVVATPPLMRTEMDAVVREADQKEFVRKKNVTVAVNKGNTNYELFLADHYPGWKVAYYDDTPAGLEAVANGEADCVVISNYRYSNISKQCEELHLTTVYTGVDIDYCFAVTKGNTELYSILSRVTNAVPDAPVHKALTYYSTEDVKTSFADLIKDNLLTVLLAIAIILLIFLILLMRSIRMERRAREGAHMVNDLNRRVFVDALTSVRNKGAFDEYIRQLQEKVDANEAMEFAVGVFDCDDLKRVNDQYGHDKGDLYLKAASSLICRVFQHSPVFRIGGDEFAVILQNDDLRNREELVKTFEEEQKKITSSVESRWEEVSVALGIAVYDPELDHSVSDTARRADQIMYENKRLGKAAQKA